MRRRIILLVGLALVLLPASNNMQAQSGGNYDVQWNVIGGSAGEGFVAGGNYQLGFTLAQVQEPQVSSGGNYQVGRRLLVRGTGDRHLPHHAHGGDGRQHHA